MTAFNYQVHPELCILYRHFRITEKHFKRHFFPRNIESIRLWYDLIFINQESSYWEAKLVYCITSFSAICILQDFQVWFFSCVYMCLRVTFVCKLKEEESRTKVLSDVLLKQTLIEVRLNEIPGNPWNKLKMNVITGLLTFSFIPNTEKYSFQHSLASIYFFSFPGFSRKIIFHKHTTCSFSR